MRHTGLVRKFDDLGRITVPSEIRKKLHFDCDNSSVEFFLYEDGIFLRKFQTADIFSGSTEDLIEYKGMKVSKKSILELVEIAGYELKQEGGS